MKYRPIRLAMRLRIIRVITRSKKLKYLTVDFIIQSKIKNVQALWILLIYRDRENGVTLF